MVHVNVGEIVKENNCYDGRDESLDTNVLDEDRLVDELLEPLFEEEPDKGGIVADFHVCEIFPERWFDLVLVLRAKTDVLYDRLTARNYSDRKRSENVECEIMQVVLEEARDAYDPAIVHEVQSNTLQDMEGNVARVEMWMKQWVVDNASKSGNRKKCGNGVGAVAADAGNISSR